MSKLPPKTVFRNLGLRHYTLELSNKQEKRLGTQKTNEDFLRTHASHTHNDTRAHTHTHTHRSPPHPPPHHIRKSPGLSNPPNKAQPTQRKPTFCLRSELTMPRRGQLVASVPGNVTGPGLPRVSSTLGLDGIRSLPPGTSPGAVSHPLHLHPSLRCGANKPRQLAPSTMSRVDSPCL